MPRQKKKKSTFIDVIAGQCDCACPDGSIPQTRVSSPAIVYLEITAACNNLCLGCPNEHTLSPGTISSELNLDQWVIILSRLQPGVRRIKLTGGEPTLYPEFEKLITLLDNLELPFDVFTNGRWLDSKSLVKTLSLSSHLGGCLISLHGPDPETHESYCNFPGAFQETVENIRMTRAAGIPVVISTIITQYNYDRIKEMIAFSKMLGASHIVFNRYLGLDLPGVTPLPGQLAYAMQCIDDQISLGHKAKFGVCIPHCFYPSSSLGCIAGVAACTIDSFGNVRPCNHSPTVVGNLLYEDLHQLWDSREMKSWSRSPDNCRGCSSIATCRGGCRAQAQLSGKEMDPLAGRVLMPAHPDWLGNTSILEEV